MIFNSYQTDKTIRAIKYGGTGADTAAGARQNINVIGLNPITSTAKDTPANWVALGSGIAYYNKASCLNNQPSTNGFIENRVYGSTVHQTFYLRGSNGKVWVRSGNSSGWNTSWVELLNADTGVQRVKLWENGSSTSSMSSQTVTLSAMADYDYIEIICAFSTSYPKRLLNPILIPITAGYQGVVYGSTYYRTFTIQSITSVSIDNAGSNNNTFVIPVRINGIKGVL